MPKRITVFLLMLILSITVSSCGQSSAYGLWKNMCDTYPEQQGAVTVISDNDEGDYHIEYSPRRSRYHAKRVYHQSRRIAYHHTKVCISSRQSLVYHQP